MGRNGVLLPPGGETPVLGVRTKKAANDMFDPTKDGRHWLWTLAEVSGLLSAQSEGDAPPVTPATPITEAWATTARACELTEGELASFVAYRFGLPRADLTSIEPAAMALVPSNLARERTVVPLRADKRRIAVATADPTAFDAEQDLRFVSARFPAFEIAPPGEILAAIDGTYGALVVVAAEPVLPTLSDDLDDSVQVVEDEDGVDQTDADDLDSGPVVKLTNLILNDAVAQGATDVHIQPCGNNGVVRFRVDGVLRRYLEIPHAAHIRVVSRVKILGRMDISDKLRPQDGRARIQTNGRTYDLRMSTVPARTAEKAVIRILDPESSADLVALGIPGPDLDAFFRLLSHRNGIVPVTGPTGSGKTTTLYGALQRLTTPEVNVMTVEDPIEYELRGVTQIQVEPKRGLTFANALRSILRQDPDIVLIGEIRDRETAEIAVQASLTGHLVLTTLHTNDAMGTIRRLTDLGLDATAICETLRGAVAQRLARRLCQECAEPITEGLTQHEEELARRFGVRPVKRARGCSACLNQGYKGRMPLLQIFFMTPEVEEAIREGRSPSALRAIAENQGMRSLLDAGRDRIADGTTTIEEIERVIGDVSLVRRQEQLPAPRKVAVSLDIALAPETSTARDETGVLHGAPVADEARSETEVEVGTPPKGEDGAAPSPYAPSTVTPALARIRPSCCAPDAAPRDEAA